ncbi:basic proline-rich protein-like [Pipra filicauda]|uniref:Basic proline-rich protein-like n=1 Tax=Pipra filicauda TaxID=649802 RepID=A0A6J2FVH1_9PASS|nr:basic proline-rich protein-like [Pipra filicauda]
MVKTDFKLPFCLTTKDWELLGRQIWIAANSNDKAAIHANIAWTHIVTILEMQEKDSEPQRESSAASLRGLGEGGRSKSPRETGEEGDHERQPWAGIPLQPPPSRSAHGGAAPPVPDTAGGFGTGQPQPPAQMGPAAATPSPGFTIGTAPAPLRAPPPRPPLQRGEKEPPAASSSGIPPRPPPPLPPRAGETIPLLPSPDFPQPPPLTWNI